MSGRSPNQPHKGKLVEQKIKSLSVFPAGDENKKFPKSSPSYRDLNSGPSRVKKLSKLFEEKSKTYSARTNWWLEEKVQAAKIAEQHKDSPKPRNSICRIVGRLSNSPVKLCSKLDRIINELLQKELSYIQSLERGIDYYVSAIKEADKNVPALLRYQTFRLFGNVEEIFRLHKDSVYPRLLVCNGNARRIAETISSFIQNELFYCYIIYAINQKSADQLIYYHSEFFESLRATSDDLLGIHSFMIQPIQKLPRYKMLLDEMIKELSRDLPFNKEVVAACCVAEKNVQRLLNRLNEALSMNDIIETHEYTANIQLGLLTTMQQDFGVSLSEPMMLLVPKSSSNFGFRSPINVFSLGKFIKCSTLKAHELATARAFHTKVFLFEKCLLYTKIINAGTLGYRNHFTFGSGFAFITKESQVSFRICGVNKKHDVIFSCDNIESIAEMKKLISMFYDPRRSGDSAFVDGFELMISEDQDNVTDDEDWIVPDFMSHETVEDDTMHVANSRFYVKSPEPEFN